MNSVDLGGINFNALRIFFEVASKNSFLEASNKLFLSQPAISKSIANLEKDLNVKLFYRANRGISLTPSGEILYKNLKHVRDILETCQREILSINDVEESHLVVGVQSHIVRNYFMNKIDHFKLNHPNVQIELIDSTTSNFIELLENRKLDFVIDSSPIESIYNNISIEPICSLSTCFIKSKGNDFKINSIKDLEKENIILPINKSSLRKNLNKIFDDYKVSIKTRLEFDTEELIIESTRRNLGIGYVVEPAISYLIETGILEKLNVDFELPKLEINLVKIDNYLTPVAKLFIEEEIINEN